MTKFIKWKTLIITSLICLLPILLGVTLWDKLPDSIAIHFNLYNEPDGFSGKGFAIFGIPIIMALLQMFCCVVNDINSHKYGEIKKLERLTIWIIPAITIVLYVSTLAYSLGWNVDIRRVAGLIIGIILIITGNYLPKLNYVKNYDLDEEKARKINRFAGIGAVIIGVFMLISLLLPPIATVVVLFLMILYIIVAMIYGFKIARGR